MKSRVILIVFCLLILTISVRAQDDAPEWRLKTPTADEYLQTILDIAPELNQEYSSSFYISSLERVSSALFYRFPDPREIRFDALLKAYTATDIGKRDILARGLWVERMIAAWISENHIDLSQTKQLQFDDFYIDVIPRDFNNDGVDEYLLDAIKGSRVDRKSCIQEAEVVAYYVVEQSNDGYQFVETGLPWKGFAPSGRYSYSDGGMIEVRFDDLNADGLPEWVILVGGETYGGPGMGYMDGGGLLVLGWRNNRLSYLVPVSYAANVKQDEITTNFVSEEALCDAGPYPKTVTWDFKNIDSDAPLEIFQVQRYINNWNCERKETEVFDWLPDDDRYSYTSTQIAFAETTQNCVQQKAEEAMWIGDYSAAIPLLEQALDLEPLAFHEDYRQEYATSLNQYLRARLSLAYTMIGQAEKATLLLQSLRSEDISEETILQFVDVLIEAQQKDFSSLQTCAKVYRVFTQTYPEIRVGYTGDDRYYNGYNPYQPEKMGCDAPTLLKQMLVEANIATTVSPINYFSGLGIGIVKSIRFDTDHGAVWLVWTDIPGVAILLSPKGDSFQISYPTLDPFLQSQEIQPIQLPDDSGSGIAMVSKYFTTYNSPPWLGAYSMDFGGLQGPPPCTLPDGTSSIMNYVGVFQLEESDFTQVFSDEHCGTSLDTVLSKSQPVTELRLNAVDCLNDFCTESSIHQEIYFWDAEEKTYKEPDAPEETHQPTSVPQPTRTPEPFPQYYSALNAFNQRDFEAVMGKTSEVFLIINDVDLNAQLGDYYLRALTLEALDRPDEALAEYVAIYEAAPESAWGKLARLHLECVRGCA